MTPPLEPPVRSDDTGWEAFDDWADDPASGAGATHGVRDLFDSLDDDPRVKAGVEHLQRAAHEVIAASRALLDVADDLVDAPGGITKMFTILGELGDLAQRAARSQAVDRTEDGPDADPPVQRIPVS